MPDVLQINKNVFLHKGKKIIIYGLNVITKSLLMRLVESGVYVCGFLTDDGQNSLIRFLNKPMVQFADIIDNAEQYVILDAFGDNIASIKKKFFGIVIQAIEVSVNELIIYGAGRQGKKVFDLLSRIGFTPHCFCDIDEEKQKKLYCGLPTISPQELKQRQNANVVVAVDKDVWGDVSSQLVSDDMVEQEKILLFNVNFCDRVELVVNESLVIYPHNIYRFIHLCQTKSKIVLFGDKRYAAIIAKSFSLFDLPIAYIVDADSHTEIFDNIECRSVWDLLYENDDDLLVIVLPAAKQAARRFAVESNIKLNCFIMLGGMSLKFDYLLDPTLGYNVCGHLYAKPEKSFITVNNIKTDNTSITGTNSSMNIGIIGGSTSDVLLYNEKSWPEHLSEICAKHKIYANFYCAATGGYNVAQETLKFIRDLSHKKLDILISFSRVNEFDKPYPFFNDYQEMLANKLAKHYGNAQIYGVDLFASHNQQQVVCYGDPIDDIGRHWFHYQKIMNGICMALGIKFYSIIQPWLFDKHKFNDYDIEVIETANAQGQYIEERTKTLAHIYDYVKPFLKNCTWLHDLTEVFDDCQYGIYLDPFHVTSKGNEMIAEKIFDLMKNELNIRSIAS